MFFSQYMKIHEKIVSLYYYLQNSKAARNECSHYKMNEI